MLRTLYLLHPYSVEDKIVEPDHVRSLLQDLEKIRMDRIRMGLHELANKSKNDSFYAVKVGCDVAVESTVPVLS